MCLDCDRHTSAIGDGPDAVWDAELEDEDDAPEDDAELEEVFDFWVWADRVRDRVHAAAAAAAAVLAQLEDPAATVDPPVDPQVDPLSERQEKE